MKAVLGIEIGGTKIQAGIGLVSDDLIAFQRRTVDPGLRADGVRRIVVELVNKILVDNSMKSGDLCGVGVGFGGPVDRLSGTVLVSHQIEGWAGFALRTWIEEQFRLPVVVLNDADAAGLAEARLGAGKGYRRVFFMTVGSGIGGAWIKDGQMDDGQGIGMAEIGHTWIPHPQTGRPVQLEDLCSGWAMSARTREAVQQGAESQLVRLCGGDTAGINGQMIYQAAERGDDLALRIIDETCEGLALGISNIVALYHPQCIILGGGVSLMGALFWESLREKLSLYVFPPFASGSRLLPAALRQRVVVVGAVLAGLDGTLKRSRE
jgi:glucokinase